jgi:hypothetical protein
MQENPVAPETTSSSSSSAPLPEQTEIIVVHQPEPENAAHIHSHASQTQQMQTRPESQRGQWREQEKAHTQERTQKKYDHTRHNEGDDRSHQGHTNNSQGQQHYSHYGSHNYYDVPLVPPLMSPIKAVSSVPPLVKEQIIPDWFFDDTNNNGNVGAVPPIPPIIPSAPPLNHPAAKKPTKKKKAVKKNEAPPAAQPLVQPEQQESVAQPTENNPLATEESTPCDELDPAYEQNPYNSNDIPCASEQHGHTLPENKALSQLPQPPEWPRKEEHPYMPAPYQAPAYGTPHYNSGNGGSSPSGYSGPTVFPASKTLESTPYQDTVVQPYRKAFSVLTPSELAKKRHERMIQKKK